MWCAVDCMAVALHTGVVCSRAPHPGHFIPVSTFPQAVSSQPGVDVHRRRRLNVWFNCTFCDIKYHAQYWAIPVHPSEPRYRGSCPGSPVDSLLEPYPEASAVQARCVSCQHVVKIGTHNTHKFRKWLESCPPPRGLRNLTMITDSDSE